MVRNRSEKRKLARLSNKTPFIKSYNHKVRKHNENVHLQRKKNKRFEYLVTLVILIVFGGVLALKIWHTR